MLGDIGGVRTVQAVLEEDTPAISGLSRGAKKTNQP
jgi:hypothetical protein